jgi:hypothetical protein
LKQGPADQVKAKGAALRCLNFGDNGSATGQLLFQIIGAIAEFERALMLERQRAAIADDPAASGDDDAVGARVEVSKRNSSNVRFHSARINNGTPAHPNQCRRLAGYKVVRVPFKDGRPEGYYENFATGFWASGEQRAEVWGHAASAGTISNARRGLGSSPAWRARSPFRMVRRAGDLEG